MVEPLVGADVAFGMTLVILVGGIDLSVGALLALVGALGQGVGSAFAKLGMVLAAFLGFSLFLLISRALKRS